MKKILLLGGSGDIGKGILNSFLVDKYEIYSPTSKELNLLSMSSVNNFFIQNKIKYYDTCIFAASKPAKILEGSYGTRYFSDTGVCFENLKMFFNFIDYEINYKKLIYLGSGACYDKSKELNNVTESKLNNFIPETEHGLYKHIISRYIEKTDRCTNLILFGIFSMYENDLRFITNTIKKCIREDDIIIKENRLMSYLYIDDFIKILDYFIENDTKYKTYNVTPDKNFTNCELALIIKEITNSNSSIRLLDSGTSYIGSNKRLKSEIKDLKFSKIEDNIKEMYNYYKGDKSERNI